jgi:hypothetical protein
LAIPYFSSCSPHTNLAGFKRGNLPDYVVQAGMITLDFLNEIYFIPLKLFSCNSRISWLKCCRLFHLTIFRICLILSKQSLAHQSACCAQADAVFDVVVDAWPEPRRRLACGQATQAGMKSISSSVNP